MLHPREPRTPAGARARRAFPGTIARTVATLLPLAAPAGAQTRPAASDPDPRPLSFGVGAGASFPVGDLSNGTRTGYTIGALAEWHPGATGAALRFEGTYNRFDVKSSILSDIVTRVGANVKGNVTMWSGTANLLYVVGGQGSSVQPYVIGGMGVYRLGGGISASLGNTTIRETDQTQTKFGVNGGFGLSLPLSGMTAYLEARVHSVYTDGGNTSYVPVTVGFRF